MAVDFGAFPILRDFFPENPQPFSRKIRAEIRANTTGEKGSGESRIFRGNFGSIDEIKKALACLIGSRKRVAENRG